MTNEHSENNFMDQNTTQPQSNQGAAVLVGSGTLLGAALLVVEAEVRYWEDAYVDGEEDTEGTLIPLCSGALWKPVIELATGQIQDWPIGKRADIHYKVCDQGQYWLADASGNRRWKYRGDYVPDSLLCVGDRGYGDYIIFSVGPDGVIEEWRTPTLDAEQWECLSPNKGI